MALDQAQQTEKPVQPVHHGDSSGDKPVTSAADNAPAGALKNMQAEALPAPGQPAAAPRSDLRSLSGSQPAGVPHLELYDSAAEGAKGAKPETAGGAKPFDEVSRSPNFDPHKPTAAFLDEFKDKNVMVTPDTNAAHGEISRAAAEKAGFNTIALQFNDDGNRGANDYSKHFNAVADKIQSGELPLGKGDLLNVSMGNADPTFKEASQFVGFPVTTQNLAGEKDHILQRMGEISKDPSRSDADRETASRVVRTNEAIDRVQKSGAEVVQAAGNSGADRFSLDFMNAKTQLSSNKPSGKADDFSADHSLTTKADGVLPVKINNEVNALDPTPVKNQAGTAEIGDTGVKFPERGSLAFLGNTNIFDRETIKPEYSQPRAITANVAPTPGDFSPALTQPKSPAAAAKLGDVSPLPSDQFSGKADPTGRVPKAFPIEEQYKSMYKTPQPGQQLVAGHVEGTSFSNISYNKANFDRLQKLKNGQ